MPVLQALLTVSEVTSGAASTSIADLEAALEVAKTDRFYNKLSNTGLQAFSSMHILTIPHLQNTIVMIFNDGANRFCTQF